MSNLGQQEEKHLPPDKIEKLKEKVGDEVRKVMIDSYKELRKNEVSSTDSYRIVKDGAADGWAKYHKDLSENP